MASAAQRVGASGPVDVEGDVYGGTASGGWACGADARVKTGGVGAQVRAHPLSDDGKSGLLLDATGALEHRVYVLDGCKSPPCDAKHSTVPPATLMAAARPEIGYDWRYFGVAAGAIFWERYENGDDRLPVAQVWPDVQIRGGRVDGIRATAGLGAYDAPTLLRPGLWLGAGFCPAEGWDVEAHGGVHQVFDGNFGARVSVSGRAPVTSAVKLGAGAAVSEGLRGIEPDGRIFLVVSP